MSITSRFSSIHRFSNPNQSSERYGSRTQTDLIGAYNRQRVDAPYFNELSNDGEQRGPTVEVTTL